MQNLIDLNTIADHLIRPAKFAYTLIDLGPPIFEIKNIIYQRIDCNVNNQKNNKLKVSIWRYKDTKKNQPKIKKEGPVLIYLHCNCGSRIQSKQLLNKSLQNGYTFVAYDSRACGHSQGQYISLGYHQIYDLQAVIKHICKNFVLEPQIVLWGRSMGAVTALNYLCTNFQFIKNIKLAVLDSPFVSLKEVICETANKKVGAPKMLVNIFLSYLQPIVEQKAKFKISQFDLRRQISQIKCPLILMASKSDGLIPFEHLEQIYQAHKGRKSIFYLNQSHTDQRTYQTISKIFKAIQQYFIYQTKQSQLLKNYSSQKKLNITSIQIQSYRSSQFCQSQLQTSPKLSNIKKMILTSSNSKIRKQLKNIELFKQTKNTQNELIRNSSIKQKLSLNHCQNNIKIKTIKSTIQFNKNQQKSVNKYMKQNYTGIKKIGQQKIRQFDQKYTSRQNKQNINKTRISVFHRQYKLNQFNYNTKF